MDDNQWEPDEEFFLKLQQLPAEDGGEVKLGRTSIMEIMILNDDGRGSIIVLFLMIEKGQKSMHLNPFSKLNTNMWPFFIINDLHFRLLLFHIPEPGTFQFEKRGHLVKESCGNALISVIRYAGV